MTELPGWFEPLLTRVHESDATTWTRLPTPADGRASAVLVLLGETDHDGPDVLILQRAATMRSHAGQPAFPGGASDPDDDGPAATALREAAEEVGLDPDTVEVVTELPTLWIPVSGFLVTPVLAWWREPHPVRPVALEEVEAVRRVPLAELVDPANRLRIRHSSGFVGPAFQAGEMLVWGFTAGVLSTLLELGGWARPWPTDRIEDLPDTSAVPLR
ncbi:CoA pyrophosphatase [Virgisporangium ochraceum]|uniref:Coenzyme A pyrophosphatase n=1 Tax=Virgisporangium ochraceum TaxID=65505 RepID=A0A8J4A2R3_9ACTN|nr:CoA pyrophosphatase [Virgisporangium ochraceum]GIJ74674.1 coenzyme A pyrophosphatase [Virgisporangium ochraceum]